MPDLRMVSGVAAALSTVRAKAIGPSSGQGDLDRTDARRSTL
jgi:hypothetical protein